MSRLQLLTSWSKSQTCVLLEELEKHPILYDQGHPLYSYRSQRIVALQKIAAKLSPIKPHMTPKIIGNKIRVLRSQYSKEKNYIRISLENLQPGLKPYKPKLWCFDMLRFLDKKGTYDNIPMPSHLSEKVDVIVSEDMMEDCIKESNGQFNSFEEVDFEELAGPQEEIESIQGNQTQKVLHSKCLKLVECLTKEMQTIQTDKGKSNRTTPNTFLGLMVETELSKVTEDIYDDAKWKIIRILEEASKKNREAKMRPVQINSPSTSAPTSSSKSSYNLGRETTVTRLDNVVFKIPIQTPINSRQKIMEITRSMQKS